MKNKSLLLLIGCLLAGSLAMANSGEKNRKEIPDMNGSITEAATGKPLKDVFVTAYESSRKEKVVLSDGNGNFSLTDLKPGKYKFVFEKDGFKKVVREKIVLKINEDQMLNIEMDAEEVLFDLMPGTLHFTGK